MSVLCVYEDPLFLDRLCRNLEESGDVFVEISVSVEDALHLMVYVHFDAVVTDFIAWNDVPDGFLKTVRQQGSEVPFIYFFGHQQQEPSATLEEYRGVTVISWDSATSAVPFDRLSECIHRIARTGQP
ncbi:MAG: response regulator [Methanomicrobiales archaeon]|nr:response regulator [Methanomicrobiales archaeon]